MYKLYLMNCVYDTEKQRIITFFSKDPYSNKYDFVLKEKFNPYLYIEVSKELVQKILCDFKKEIKIEKTTKNPNILKIIAKNKDTLHKVHKVLLLSIKKTPFLVDIERQYLIEKNWSYYDLFLIVSSNKIKKIENTNVSSVVKKYINTHLNEEQFKLIENLTKNILLSNILKIKINDVKKQDVMNTFFENIYFENQISLKNNSHPEILKNRKKLQGTFEINFSNIWPYLLTKEFYNISPDTYKCECCSPNSYLNENVLLNSLVKVKFKVSGFYFISKDKKWAYYKYHLNTPNKENRINFMKMNALKEMPVGPFYKEDIASIPLIDAIKLKQEKNIEILEKQEELKWVCEKKESFLSLTLKKYLKKLKSIEQSINLSTSITYNKSFKNKNDFENNPVFLQYLTEYKLLTDLIEEIPKFLEHSNTKFYDPDIDESIKYLKLQTIENLNQEEFKFIVDREKVIVKEKKIIENINIFFPKQNLPIPKLIIN